MKNLLLVVLILTSVQVKSQKKDTLISNFNTPKQVISISPLKIFNRFPTIYFHYESSITKRSNLNVGVGIVYPVWSDDITVDMDFYNRSGYKFNGEWKIYFPYNTRSMLYTSFLAEYFNLKFNRARTFGFDCIAGGVGCNYYQFDDYEITRTHYRLGVKFGIMSKITGKFTFDYGLGLVLDMRHYDNTGRLENFDYQFGNTDLMESGTLDQILLVPTFKVGYSLKRVNKNP